MDSDQEAGKRQNRNEQSDTQQEQLRAKREQSLKVWAYEHIAPSQEQGRWSTVSGDASFRRYFRIESSNPSTSWIAVDAPPDKENNPAFIDILQRLEAACVVVPKLMAVDIENGFMLLSDLGDQLLLPLLTDQSVEAWYQAGMKLLLQMQLASTEALPVYSREKLRQEMALFDEWFLPGYLGLELDQSTLEQLHAVYARLEESALEQPQCFVHRDYHARNLMVLGPVEQGAQGSEERLGVIDFQDAVKGPITYDLASLIKDCYKEWPIEQVDGWVQQFRVDVQTEREDVAINAAVKNVSKERWQRWFDWMGLQRHIKVAGIFSRLYFRDGKEGYLKDIPRTVYYIFTMLERYRSEFGWLFEYMSETIIPALVAKDPKIRDYFVAWLEGANR